MLHIPGKGHTSADLIFASSHKICLNDQVRQQFLCNHMHLTDTVASTLVYKQNLHFPRRIRLSPSSIYFIFDFFPLVRGPAKFLNNSPIWPVAQTCNLNTPASLPQADYPQTPQSFQSADSPTTTSIANLLWI
jgi:hypothetical protein